MPDACYSAEDPDGTKILRNAEHLLQDTPYA